MAGALSTKLLLPLSMLLLLVLPMQLAAAAHPFYMRGGKKGRAKRLARMLTESQTPTLCTLAECQTLIDVAKVQGPPTPECENTMFFWGPGAYPAPQGICTSIKGQLGGTFAAGETACTGDHSGGSAMWAPRTNTERCLMTVYEDLAPSSLWYLADITDTVFEGVYVDSSGAVIDDVYLNWAAGEPTGAGENCVAYKDNEAYDYVCGQMLVNGQAVQQNEVASLCIHRPAWVPPANI